MRIELPFDKLLVDGGFNQVGVKISRGKEVYGTTSYYDLDPLLGHNRQITILNERKNHCYADCSSVHYYLHKIKPLTDFTLDGGI